MDIHNLMEDKVIQALEEICGEDEKSTPQRYCTTPQCRIDAVCYVLNRIPQRYVSSGRGFAYLEADFHDNPQLQVDIVTLIHEGLRRVTEVQRSFYKNETQRVSAPVSEAEAVFVFPTVKGRIFNGTNFEPISGVSIKITHEGKLVQMVDNRWQNPYQIVSNTPGTYLFWPASVGTGKAGVEKVFEFGLEIQDNKYEYFKHYFSLKVLSEPATNARGLIKDYSVQDLFIVPKDAAVDDMQINPTDPD